MFNSLTAFDDAPQHEVFLCGSIIDVNSSRLLGVGPVLQSTVSVFSSLRLDVYFLLLLFPCNFTNQSWKRPAAGLMSNKVSGDIYESPIKRSCSRGDAYASSPHVAEVVVKLNLIVHRFYKPLL